MRNFLAITVFLLLVSCSEDSDFDPTVQEGLSTAPDAKIDFNDSNYGVYKGILVGVSGVIQININNDDTISATLSMFGDLLEFTTTESVTLNQDIVGLKFTSGDNSFDFNVKSTGEDPYISNIQFANYPTASIEILKEYSDAHVKCYVGTYSDASGVVGVINLTTIDNALYGLAKATNDPNSYFLEAIMLGDNTFTGTFDDGNFHGLISGIAIGGDWANSSGTGTWQGRRKL